METLTAHHGNAALQTLEATQKTNKSNWFGQLIRKVRLMNDESIRRRNEKKSFMNLLISKKQPADVIAAGEEPLDMSLKSENRNIESGFDEIFTVKSDLACDFDNYSIVPSTNRSTKATKSIVNYGDNEKQGIDSENEQLSDATSLSRSMPASNSQSYNDPSIHFLGHPTAQHIYIGSSKKSLNTQYKKHYARSFQSQQSAQTYEAVRHFDGRESEFSTFSASVRPYSNGVPHSLRPSFPISFLEDADYNQDDSTANSNDERQETERENGSQYSRQFKAAWTEPRVSSKSFDLENDSTKAILSDSIRMGLSDSEDHFSHMNRNEYKPSVLSDCSRSLQSGAASFLSNMYTPSHIFPTSDYTNSLGLRSDNESTRALYAPSMQSKFRDIIPIQSTQSDFSADEKSIV